MGVEKGLVEFFRTYSPSVQLARRLASGIRTPAPRDQALIPEEWMGTVREAKA